MEAVRYEVLGGSQQVTNVVAQTTEVPRLIYRAAPLSVLAMASALVVLSPLRIQAQQPAPSKPVVVQPGAPGKRTRVLSSKTRAKLPPISTADVQFMQGMIVHHAQAVEMTALIESRTENKEVRSLGARISHSQADEITFMKRWLMARGQSVADATHDRHKHHSHSSHDLMPGMLSAEQMEALRNAKDKEFNRLFLEGMIQHHGGALTMVKDLFAAAGAGQDAELFNFATDVDSGQRAEIRIMQNMLEKNSAKDQ